MPIYILSKKAFKGKMRVSQAGFCRLKLQFYRKTVHRIPTRNSFLVYRTNVDSFNPYRISHG